MERKVTLAFTQQLAVRLETLLLLYETSRLEGRSGANRLTDSFLGFVQTVRKGDSFHHWQIKDSADEYLAPIKGFHHLYYHLQKTGSDS